MFEDGSLFIPNVRMFHAGNFSCYTPRNTEVVQNHHLDVYSESARLALGPIERHQASRLTGLAMSSLFQPPRP